MARVLFVVPHYACKPTTGGGQRTQLLFEALAKCKDISDIDVVALDEKGRSAEEFFPSARKVQTLALRTRAAVGAWSILKKFIGAKADSLATAFGRRSVLYSKRMLKGHHLDLHDYDVIVGRYLRPLAQLGCFDSGKKILLDVDDRDDVLYSSRLNTPGLNFFERLVIGSHLRQIKRIQAKLLPLCKHCWFASEADLKQLPCQSESYLPNIPFSAFAPASKNISVPGQTPATVLFIGSYGHRINREGIDWFIKNSWPTIVASIPSARLRVVGSGGWENVRHAYSDENNVEIVGFCDSLEYEYKIASLTVVPLFEGGGTKIKVLESYQYGRVACGTEHAYFGYDRLRQACSEAMASAAENLADTVIELLQKPERLSKIASDGQKIVQSCYSRKIFNESVALGFKE